MDEIKLVWSGLTNSPGRYLLYIVLGINLGLTLWHSVQELRGYLWRYFGAIVGFRIPDKLGFYIFFVGLWVGLWIIGFLGIGAPLHGFSTTKLAISCVGLIVGGRISDSIYSHIRLDWKGYRPNPALKTVPYYLIEAGYLTILFLPGIWSRPWFAALGFFLGWMLFFSVLPFLRWLRSISISLSRLSREPWQAGQSYPPWVQEYNYKEALNG
jgi:hypothetical protein